MSRGLLICLCGGVISFIATALSHGQETLDLSGQWLVRLDDADAGRTEQWFSKPLATPTTILLPNTTDQAGLGHRLDFKTMQYDCPAPATTRFPGVKTPERADQLGYLVRRSFFVGPAWYEREIDLPESWREQMVNLRLERAMWRTDIWVDGVPKGHCDSLVSEHRYELGVLPPGKHRLTIRVDNRMIHNISTITHAYGPETQSRWNGLVGRLELEQKPTTSIRSLAVYTAPDNPCLRTTIKLVNASRQEVTGSLHTRLLLEHTDEIVAESAVTVTARPGTSEHEAVIELREPAIAWNEFQPARYRLVATWETPAGATDQCATLFGFRHIETVGNQIHLNGQRIFLRGTLDCCVYPRTGHPPMTVPEWKRTLETVKRYGFNHVRFHTWCPPEAAFEAADQLGLYLLAETPAWVDDWGVETVTQPKGIGHDPEVVAYLRAEMRRISEAYGNHPSFVMFTIGNEFGRTQTDWKRVGELVREIKELDPRRLYSGCCARRCLDVDDFWISHRTTAAARGIGPAHTAWDFTEAVAGSDKPLISHETGQRPVFPNYSRLLPKFTGPLLPLNYDRHRRSLLAHGLAAQAPDFVRASARFQNIQYKSEHEAMLRTPGLAGYQLLMLNDFSGQSEAIVGILDPFGESKGVVSPEEIRRWNAPSTLLAQFPKYVWNNQEMLTAQISLVDFGQHVNENLLSWSLTRPDGTPVAEGSRSPEKIERRGQTELVNIHVPLDGCQRPTALTLHAQWGNINNQWKVWVVPAESPTAAPEEVLITQQLDPAAIDALLAGRTVLWLAHGTKSAHAAKTGFASVYWSAGWWGNAFSSLGILCDPQHPLFSQFPNAGHSDWLWHDLCDAATTLRLDGAPAGFRPLVQPIPDFHYNELLAHVFEARVGNGALLACGYDVTNNLDRRPAARQFRKSLFDYLGSQSFAPQQKLSPAWLDQRFGSGTLKPKDTGYRGIWFTLGQYSDAAGLRNSPKRYWEFGDKYSGGLGTYTAKHVPIAVYAPQVNKTFFCYGGSKNGERYLYNMISFYDHRNDTVPRPTIIHDKQGINDPHDNSSLTIDTAGYIWVYVAGRGRSRPAFVYRSAKPYDIERFEMISSDEICYPQPYAVAGQGILELFTKYTGVRELYWNVRHSDGTRGPDRKLAGMEGQYQTSAQQAERIITAFNRHPQGTPDTRTDLYYLETRDMGQSWQTIDGTSVTTPLVDPNNAARVQAYSQDKRLVYLNSITLDQQGNPIILIVTSSDHRAGPQGDPRRWEVLHHKNGQWHAHAITNSTHNYDTGPLWVEADGSWHVMGPTERGPQQWGCGGEIALWSSSDEGATWSKQRDVTRNSPRNHSYVRPVNHAPHDSPFALLWADGNPRQESISRLYFSNRAGTVVRQLPYDMQGDSATPGDAEWE